MNDVWQVKMASGEVRSLDVDQLDAAFQAGWVFPQTPVLRFGEATWTTLAEAAGLEEREVAPYSIAPIALDPTRAELDVEIDLASDTDASAFRPRRARGLLAAAAFLAFVGVAGFGGMKVAQRTSVASAPPPPPATLAVAPPPPAAPAAATKEETTAPKATNTVSVSDLPNAKKVVVVPAVKRRRK